jgi:hypothetical protein
MTPISGNPEAKFLALIASFVGIGGVVQNLPFLG